MRTRSIGDGLRAAALGLLALASSTGGTIALVIALLLGVIALQSSAYSAFLL